MLVVFVCKSCTICANCLSFFLGNRDKYEIVLQLVQTWSEADPGDFDRREGTNPVSEKTTESFLGQLLLPATPSPSPTSQPVEK